MNAPEREAMRDPSAWREFQEIFSWEELQALAPVLLEGLARGEPAMLVLTVREAEIVAHLVSLAGQQLTATWPDPALDAPAVSDDG